MKHFFFALIASAAALSNYAQNLVPNPSFEEYLECPFSTAGLDNLVVDWFCWQLSADFFHTCSNELEALAGVPENVWGHQSPITGLGYAGVITFVDFLENGREYMAAPLTNSLVPGELYYLMVHVSLCDSSESITRKCATNNLGMRFFKDPTYSYFPPVNAFQADNFAHLNYNEIITDDQNWTLVEGWFTADEAYNWVAIGNFFDDQNTATAVLNDQNRCSAVYYIENVCVAIDPADCDYLLNNPKAADLDSYFKVYPNPALDEINVLFEIGDIEQLTLYDSLGRILSEYGPFYSGSARIDVSTFQAGLYVLSVKSKNQIFNQKIIIK